MFAAVVVDETVVVDGVDAAEEEVAGEVSAVVVVVRSIAGGVVVVLEAVVSAECVFRYEVGDSIVRGACFLPCCKSISTVAGIVALPSVDEDVEADASVDDEAVEGLTGCS